MIKINDLVNEALQKGRPVVALESTIITHGMPYPQNFETALKVEDEVRNANGTPATIGIINGEIVVGLTPEQIEFLAKSKDSLKVSTREIPLAIEKKASAGTTVSATSFIAEISKINVFATGGIGGVHREVLETFDISRDLEELSLRNIIIVSSGVKSILDVEKTFEYLETKGVLVVGYKTNEFPTFYSRHSGIKIESVDEHEIAELFRIKKKLGINGAILVANPIPEEYEIPYETVELWINEAISEMKEKKIKGKLVTPFLLEKIFELSKGKSLQSNIALIKNNAKVATLIANEIAKNGLD